MTIRRLIYASQVARQVRYADAEGIAQAASDRNQRAGITGLSLYTPSHFIQVLEGDHDALTATLSRIARDPRHSQLRLLDDRDVDVREFGSWAMTARFCAAHPSDIAQLDAEGALALLRLPAE